MTLVKCGVGLGVFAHCLDRGLTDGARVTGRAGAWVTEWVGARVTGRAGARVTEWGGASGTPVTGIGEAGW